jgi:hypothetical protein
VHTRVLQSRTPCTLPDVLIVRLVRDCFTSPPSKHVHHVRFEHQFRIGSDDFFLTAVIEHIGNTMQNGHYVAYCYQDDYSLSLPVPVDGEPKSWRPLWRKINDGTSKIIAKQDVLLVQACILVFQRCFPVTASHLRL